MRLLRFILILMLGLPVAALADNFDQVKFDYPAEHVTHIVIFEPNVKQPKTDYKEIVFKPGDRLFITAGGCVQTGGMGTTTKSYVFPGGGNSGHLYSGTIYIPGVSPPGSENGYERIVGYINRPLVVQAVPPGVATEDQFLHLGYEDDEYDDNSYDSFDDGPDGQCRGQGPAFVSLWIDRTPHPPVDPMTPAALPFDLTWRSSHIEGNALPVNPWWKGQINPGSAPVEQDWRLPTTPVTVPMQPDFKAVCGGAFSWNYATIGLDYSQGVLMDACTKQGPTLDIDKSIFVSPVGYCSPDPISGHLEWGFATYTGVLKWQEWGNPSNFADDDANFQLFVPSGAGMTDLNGGAIGLEFRVSESLNNFQSAFWKTVASRVGNSDPMPLSAVSGDRYNQLLQATFDNNFAVVTGLVGIDGVHGGYTELHPVTSMAVCTAGCQAEVDTDGVPIIEGADQTWAFFIQNFGAGGGCSELEHTWAGLDDPDDPKSFWYFLSLPVPVGVKDAPRMTSPDIHGADLQPAAGPISWHGWTLFGFRLPDPTGGAGGSVDGVFQLHYPLAAGAPKKRAAPPKFALRARTEDPELGNIVERVRDPAVAVQLRNYLTAHPLPTRPTAPHAFVLQVQARNASAEAALARVDKGEMAAKTLDHPRVDAERLRARLQVLADVQKIVGPAKTSILPPQPAVETRRP